MAVLMVAEVPGQTRQGYERMLETLSNPIRQADGFIAHWAHPVEGGWRCMELWQSKAQANEFYARNVVPHLPPGIHPKRSIEELHRLVMPQ